MITKHDQLRMAIHAELAPYDAFGGAAYGKKEMPFAITAGIAAGSAMAAGAAITAAGVAAVVAGTAVAAGLTMTIVGMATGDKELMKIGGYVGLAGGIAGMKPDDLAVPVEAQRRHAARNSIFKRKKPNTYFKDKDNSY